MKTTVFLVGAGPGDPGLITVKAEKLLKIADVIVYDYLSNPIFLNKANNNCKLINAGKRLGFKAMSQAQINKKLVSLAKQRYKNIVRLKGGDPLLFGRGGEEAEYLKKNKINFEIVPGITSAIAVPAYAGIPISHRDSTSSFCIVTGHEDPEKNKSNLNWKAIAAFKSIIFLMGTKNLKSNIGKLIENGIDKNSKIAVIQWGTHSMQKTVEGNLSNIFSLIKQKNIKSPAVIVIGDVCKYRKNLRWFEKKPLFGKSIVVTRARKDASNLVEQIFDLGGEAIEIPSIEIKPIFNKKNEIYIKNSTNYDWLVFTSVNGVEEFFSRFIKFHHDIRKLGKTKIATIGSETARSVKKYGLKVDLIPKKFIAESLIKEFKNQKVKENKILIPRAADSRELLIEELRKMDNKVDEMKIYKSILPSKKLKNNIRDRIMNENIFGVTFTSSSTVDNFFKFIDSKTLKRNKKIKFFCIGPITANTLKKYNLRPNKIAKEFTIKSLINEVIKS